MGIDVIIVHWNTLILLKQCLESLEKTSIRDELNITVWDNNSKESLRELKKKFSKVKFHMHKTNVGLSRAINKSIQKSKNPWILLMHPDTTIEQDAPLKLKEFLEQNEKVAATGPQLIYPNNELVLTTHTFPKLSALTFEVLKPPKRLVKILKKESFYMQYWNHDHIKTVDTVTSPVMMIRRSTWNEIGEFDEKFSNWFIEMDWCYRAKQKGWSCVYFPYTQGMHYERMSFQKEKKEKSIAYKQDAFIITDKMMLPLFIFYKKHYSKLALAALWIGMILGLSFKSIKAYISGNNPRERTHQYLKTIKNITTKVML